MQFPLADVLRDLSRWFNYAEVAIWPVMGVVLLAAGFRRSGVVRRDYWLAAAVLIAFGPTDYFEAEHGNEWWHPWWLLLWKAACVIALLAIVGSAWRRERRERRESTRPQAKPATAASKSFGREPTDPEPRSGGSTIA